MQPTSEEHITVPKTARYFKSGTLSHHTKRLVIVLHGYSQSAEYFIRKFRGIVSEETVVVAPEGLHRFYLAGHAGRVGASWMTKVDRLVDIQDYCTYLDLLAKQLVGAAPNAKVEVLGFSQGGATAVRWVTSTSYSLKRLILWAGSFPHDVDLGSCASRLNDLNLQVVVGKQDEFISQSDIVNVETLLKSAQVQFQLHQFEGGHDIDSPLLLRLF